MFFYVDLVSTYAQGISILQNNCSLLNEKAQGLTESKALDNFCEKKTFSPVDLTFALRFINFTGYTGPISFPNDVMIRSSTKKEKQ